jgi:hypothetical protein
VNHGISYPASKRGAAALIDNVASENEAAKREADSGCQMRRITVETAAVPGGDGLKGIAC